MKKMILPAAMLAFVISLTSCGGGSSFESDVKKLADFRCKMQKLMAKDQNDEKVKKELEDLQKEAEAFGEKMEEKYKGKEDDKAMEEKAEKIMEEVMAKCK